MSDVVLSTAAWKSWSAAEGACFNYICDAVGYEDGKNAFIGDVVGSKRANLFAFNISGGPEQSQNFQCPRPSKRFLANASLLGQFLNRNQALDFAGRLLDNFPAYGDPERETGRIGQDAVILEPNVQLFEMLTFPRLESLIVEVEKVGREGKVMKNEHLWILVIDFRVAFNNQNLSEDN